MKIIKQVFSSLLNGPIYLIIFGLIFFGIGAGLTYRQSVLESAGEQAQGEVIGLSTNCDSDGCSYAPVVRFNTRDEKTITFESTYSSSPPAYEVGERVTVVYRLDSPEKAEIKGAGMTFRLIFMGVGGLIAAVGLGMFSTSVVRIFIKE
jgi:hypothetical protein